MKGVVPHLGRASFHESSHENHMLGQGWGCFQDLGLEKQAWLAGFRTPILKIYETSGWECLVS